VSAVMLGGVLLTIAAILCMFIQEKKAV